MSEIRNNVNVVDKMLLVKDLCARLPYAVTVEHTSGFRGTLHDVVLYHTYAEDDSVNDYICTTNFFGDDDYIYIEYFKPYLFPMSSMTEEQQDEMIELMEREDTPFGFRWYPTLDYFDWLNKNHFDYRGLIEKSLALDATGKNIY